MTTRTAHRTNWPVVDENSDYIFRFRLEPDRATPLIPNDAFAELFRSQLDEMLKLIFLTWQGQCVRVDGFYFIHDPDCTYPIWSTLKDTPPEE